MAASVDYAIDAYGFRISKITNSLVPGGITFTGQRLGTVISMQHPTPRAEVIEYAEGLVSGAYDFSDPNNWYLDLHSALESGGVPAYVWRTRGTIDQSAGVEALTLKAAITAGAWAAPTTVIRGLTYEQRLSPSALGGTASTCRIMVPGVESEVWGWNDARLAGDGVRWTYPGIVWSGDIGGLPYDEPKGLLAGDLPAVQGDLYFWNDEEDDPADKIGLCIRFPDSVGRGLVIELKRDGSDVLTISVTFLCNDCSVGVGGNSDTDFEVGIQYRPMVGEEYDALRWCAAREFAESWDWATNGPIGTNPNLSSLAETLVIAGYASGGNLFGDFSPYYNLFARLVDLWSLEEGDMSAQLYDFTASRPPTVVPFVNDAVAVFEALFDLGIATILYEDAPEPWNQISGTGLDPLLGIFADVIRTRDGSYVIPTYGDFPDLPITNGVPPASGYKYHLNYLDPANNLEYLDEMEDEFLSALGIKRKGNYQDTAGGEGPHADDNYRLTAAQRSRGSVEYCRANRAFHELHRARMLAKGIVDAALYGEFPNPQTTIGTFDLAYVAPIYPPGNIFYGNTCLSIQRKYGRYIRVSTYYDWGSGFGPQWDLYTSPNWADTVELRQYTTLRWLTSGCALPMQRVWLDGTDETGFVVEEGEDNFEYYQDAESSFTFSRRLYVDHKDLIAELQSKGQILRELSSSMTRRALDYEIDGTNPQVPAAKAGSIVYHLAERDLAVVLYGNWSRYLGNPVTVAISDRITKSGWPEFGDGARDVYLWNWKTGARFLLPGQYNGTEYTIGLSLPPEFAGAVLFVPEGEAPPFMRGLSSSIVTIPVTANGIFEITGAL